MPVHLGSAASPSASRGQRPSPRSRRAWAGVAGPGHFHAAGRFTSPRAPCPPPPPRRASRRGPPPQAAQPAKTWRPRRPSRRGWPAPWPTPSRARGPRGARGAGPWPPAWAGVAPRRCPCSAWPAACLRGRKSSRCRPSCPRRCCAPPRRARRRCRRSCTRSSGPPRPPPPRRSLSCAQRSARPRGQGRRAFRPWRRRGRCCPGWRTCPARTLRRRVA
mmetsp:Transcript_14358/g.42231  ORF Transcript_14358/g.42231 Transcript_14358/m.42231 type:complete len:218 (-) Transcript_14358:1112-1765(-)